MDKWTDRQTDGWVDGRTNGWMDGRVDGWCPESYEKACIAQVIRLAHIKSREGLLPSQPKHGVVCIP